MAKYDQPGHSDPLPGNPGFQSHDSGMTAPGTTGATAGTGGGGSGSPVHVSFSFDSSQGGGYVVDQGVKATNAASDPLHETISATTQTSAAWTADSSHVSTPHHPGAGAGA